MRLIDADKACKELIDSIDWLREQDYETYSSIGDDIRIALDKQPTAFDVDKVVEQLEEMKKKDVCADMSCTLCKYNSECLPIEYADQKVVIDRAIEIVKEG